MTRLIGLAALLVACAPALADDRDAAKALEAVGVMVKLDPSGTATGVLSKDSHALKPEHYKLIGSLAGLKSLTLYNKCSLTDETLALLANLPNLERVGIDGAKFTDAGMNAMSGWTNLKQMTFFHSLNGDGFTGAGAEHLAKLEHLENFGCGGSTFTDAGMAAVGKLTQLKSVRFWHTKNTDAGTAHLRNLPNLKSVRLAPQFTPKITDASLEQLAAIPSLEVVTVNETRLTWAGLQHLTKLPNLKSVNLDETDISQADMARLVAALPGVEISRKPPTDQQLEWLRKRFPAGE